MFHFYTSWRFSDVFRGYKSDTSLNTHFLIIRFDRMSFSIHALHIYIMVFTTDGFLEVAIESWPHWIPFRHSNRLSYQATSSTRTLSQLCTATPISSFVQCHISFRLFAFVIRHVCFNRSFMSLIIWV